MRNLILIFISCLTLSVEGQVNYSYYPKAEVEQDLNFAFQNLTSIHPFFLNNEELTNYQKELSTIKKSLKDSMTQNEVYLLLAPLFASVGDGHTGVIVPTDQRVQYNKAGGKSFPFFVDVKNDSIYVSFYCGNDSSLFDGGEQLLTINGIDATHIIHDMQKLYGSKSVAIKQSEIANKFRFLIWMLYGFEDDYKLEVKNNRNEITRFTVPGITSAEFMKNIKRKPQVSYSNFSFTLHQELETAVLKIKSFGDLDGFCEFADSAFAEFNKNKIENLIIDIRNNGGGRSIVVDSLMNFITDKPYSQYKKIEIRISAELKQRYKERYPDRYDWINNYAINELVVPAQENTKPLDNKQRFQGNLFLLTNSSSFSAAATFAGVFKEMELGPVIGEETGGTIAYYGDFWFLKTPNTGITFYIPPKRFIQYGGTTDYDRGVLPDYLVPDTEDSILNFTYNLIEKERFKLLR